MKKPMAPGVASTEVAPYKKKKKEPAPPGPTLEEELYETLELAVHGKPMTPQLIGDLKMACLSVLNRRGIRPGRIGVQQQGNSFVVDLALPPQTPLVRHIQIQVGGNSWTRR